MDSKTPIKVGYGAENAKPFVYEASSKLICRFFQLNYDGCCGDPNGPLAGRLLSTNITDGVESLRFRFSSWMNVAEFAQTGTIMKKLSGSQQFSALSYSWGRSRERYPLYVSTITGGRNNDPAQPAGSPMLLDHEVERNGYLWITHTLYSFLQEMRRQKFKRFIWIDALCIDQNDDNDKNNQIPRMRFVYEYAERVFVWLGEGTATEHGMLRIMTTVTTKLRRSSGGDGRSLRQWFAEEGLPDPDDDVWRACAALFMRDWWNRLWTLQEMVAPRGQGQKQDAIVNIFMICGPVQVPWDTFSDFAEALATNHLKDWLITGHEGVQPDHYHGLDAIVEVRTCRQSHNVSGWSITLGALLVATRRRQATVPADMVIGMQALLDAATIRDLALTVSLPTAEVFVRFGKHYIRNEVKECILNHTATQSRLPGLPSWCPHFASPEETISLGSRWLGHYHEKAAHRAQMPCAGFQKTGPWRLPRNRFYHARWLTNILSARDPLRNQYNTRHPRQIALLPGPAHAIIASGLELDTITAVIPPNPGAEAARFLAFNAVQQTLEWDRRCFGLARETLRGVASSHAAYDLYARTLVAGRVAMRPHEALDSSFDPEIESILSAEEGEGDGEGSEDEEEDEGPALRAEDPELFIDRHGVHDFATPYLRFRDFMRWTADAGTSLDEGILTRETRGFARCLGLLSRRRCFFATAGGRIGMGPANARVGDRVVVVFYCPTPYLIRPRAGNLRTERVRDLRDWRRSVRGVASEADLRSGGGGWRASGDWTGMGAGTEKAKAWEFVGEAYVRDWMYGEALKMFERREVDETKWVID